MEVAGSGLLRINVLDSEEGGSRLLGARTFPLEEGQKLALVIFDGEAFLQKKGQQLQLQNFDARLVNYWTCKVRLAQQISLSFNSSVRVFSHFAPAVHFLVAPEPGFQPSPDLRIQFVLETSLNNQTMQGDERARMYLNRRRAAFPNSASHESRASGTCGNGLIKTISRQSPLFCQTANCSFYVTAETANVDSFVFSATYLRNNSVLSFEDSLSLLEELSEDEEVAYALQGSSAPGMWELSLMPFDNALAVLANPGGKPKSRREFLF